jgi:hypothetical protein
MKIRTFLAATLVAAAFALPASAAHLKYFTSVLNGAQQVPPNSSSATGRASLTLDTRAQTLDFSLSVMGISLDGLNDNFVANPLGPIHLHNGLAGQNGGVIVPFAFDKMTYAGTASGFDLTVMDFAYDDAIKASGAALSFLDFIGELERDAIYINVHTDAYAGGEIRGQVAPVPLPASALLLLGAMGGLAGLRRLRR